MVRQFEFNGLPLQRIDNCGFMIGKTGTCYYRANNAWKGMLILELARGGWVNVYHGNLELLTDDDAQWFSKAQSLYHSLQQFSIESSFGEIPGRGKPYGFKAESINGSVFTVVNPSQAVVEIELAAGVFSNTAILYADGGFRPTLNSKRLVLGPEQLVVVGFDEYAGQKYNLGTDETIHIPASIEKLDANFSVTGKNTISGKVKVLTGKDIRIFFQQFGSDNLPRRSWGGAPPNGKRMNEFLKIAVRQEKKTIPSFIQYDKNDMVWLIVGSCRG